MSERLTPEERAVLKAARECFGTVTRTSPGEPDRTYLSNAICTWQAPYLADALRRLYHFPPYDRESRS